MMTYEFQTYEGCTIRCVVEGHHVAAGLDELLEAKRGTWMGRDTSQGDKQGLLVPYVIEQLLLRLSLVKAVTICQAAARAGCMPGMILAAIDRIKARAVYWHKKALREDAAEIRRQQPCKQRCDEQKQAEASGAHGDIDQETIGRPPWESAAPAIDLPTVECVRGHIEPKQKRAKKATKGVHRVHDRGGKKKTAGQGSARVRRPQDAPNIEEHHED